jgi:ubiquinone biosynthesis protein Coq4
MNHQDLYITLKAIYILLGDSDRIDQIHLIEEATGRGRFARVIEAQFRTGEGAALLRDRAQICGSTVDFDALKAMPAGTLGRAFGDHLTRHGLDVDKLAIPIELPMSPETAFVMRRMRQTHDLWHALLDVGIAPYEEVIVQAFSYGQLFLPVSGLIVLFGAVKHLVLEARWKALRYALLEAYEMGVRAAPLLPVRWEELWGEPVDRIRARFRVAKCNPAHLHA